MAQNKKVVKYRKPLQINIGIIVFVIIFIYMMYFVFRYFTSEHITFYEVSQGSIGQNKILTGLILRDETVFFADTDGYINYYNKDGTKAGNGTYLYTIDSSGDFYKQMTATDNGPLVLNSDSYAKLEETASHYTTNYSDASFYQVYNFKYDMEANLMEALSLNALNDLENYTQSDQNIGNLKIYQAEQAGVVVYNTDGLEDVNEETFQVAMFDQSSYNKNNLIGKAQVKAGEPVYKMITSEQWKVVLPIDNRIASELAEETHVKIIFKKDNSSSFVSSKILSRENGNYLVLSFENSMIRFATDRFIEIELVLSDTTKLKIPNTAIIKKDFWVVAKEYVVKGGDSNTEGVFKETIEKDEKTVAKFVPVSLFYETETEYYIDSSELAKNDIIIKPDSNDKFTLNATESLEGVYNINKGYAAFKRINIISQNEEYVIVSTGTAYGISLYDHIALDGSAIKENEIIH
ncbi:hypothetical protein LQZ18_13765 [Lachnospiraceae bacterium ZAX-1]